MSNLGSWAEEACEQIDAGFFSGDTFETEKLLLRLKTTSADGLADRLKSAKTLKRESWKRPLRVNRRKSGFY
jgi:hypothetical protein